MKHVKRLLILVIILCLIALGYVLWQPYQLDRLREGETQELYQQKSDLLLEIRSEGENGEIPNPLAQLQEQYPELIAWLTIPNTPIDFPVFQSKDNEYYTSHNADGEPVNMGVPFLDCRCNRRFTDYTSIVYGHNITHNRMFGSLPQFKDAAFFEKTPTATLILEDGEHEVYFFACLVTTSNSYVYDTNYFSPVDRKALIDWIYNDAVQSRQPEPGVKLTDQRILLLSTCSYEFDNARTVVAGYIK